MSRRTLGVAIIAAVALAAGMLWWFSEFKRVQRWVDLPPRGEAAYNPLYALKLALRADGVRVDARQRLSLDTLPPGPRDTVLVYSDPRALTTGEMDTLLAWVERGGHLLLRLPPYEFGRETTALGAPLDDALPIEPQLLEPKCVRLHDAKKDALEFCAAPRFHLTPATRPLAAWGEAERGLVFARLARGAGHIDVVSDLALLSNANLRSPARAQLARQLLAPNYREGIVHLVYAASMPPLWRWLLERAWMAALPLLLALLGWLWMRMQRFGPMLPSPPQARRSLLEHVEASGEHLYRYGRGTLLQGAVREAMLARLRRRDPLAAALQGPAQVAAVAARTGLPATEVAAALDTRAPSDAADFRARISRLIALRNRL